MEKGSKPRCIFLFSFFCDSNNSFNLRASALISVTCISSTIALPFSPPESFSSKASLSVSDLAFDLLLLLRFDRDLDEEECFLFLPLPSESSLALSSCSCYSILDQIWSLGCSCSDLGSCLCSDLGSYSSNFSSFIMCEQA